MVCSQDFRSSRDSLSTGMYADGVLVFSLMHQRRLLYFISPSKSRNGIVSLETLPLKGPWGYYPTSNYGGGVVLYYPQLLHISKIFNLNREERRKGGGYHPIFLSPGGLFTKHHITFITSYISSYSDFYWHCLVRNIKLHTFVL